ncbi:MAG: M81 family metallopeptidase, partial [Chloroflexi bacterium]|nr:M81 family metallopeptidase [Chloroflexota bacterium]
MKRIAIVGFSHETNTFALEQNDRPDAQVNSGAEVLERAHPKSYIGGFCDGCRRADVQLVPIIDISPVHGGLIHRAVYEHYERMILAGLRDAAPLDGVFFALHGAMAVEAPYTDAEACLIASVRRLLGDTLPMVATYDFHAIYTDWEVSAVVPVPLNTNPHIDAWECGVEAGEMLLRMLDGAIRPVTQRVFVPIIGPNIGQSTWSHLAEEEARLPMVQLNALRAELERTPGVLNLTLQGGYGYADTPDTGMCVIATTDGDAALAERMAKRLARALWARREDIRTVRPILPIDQGVRMALARPDGPIVLVDLGDDPLSACPADSPVVLESLLRQGASDCALTIRDPEVVRAAQAAGVGGSLNMEVGARFDRRFYGPLTISGRVKSLDDGDYTVMGPMHGGWGRDVNREAFREAHAGPRAVVRVGERIDVIFSMGNTGIERDFIKSAGIPLESKKIIVVKSNQAHRASFQPIAAAIIELDT